jgi:hypothetical protein
MNRYVIVLVELGLRSLLVIISIFCTIYVLVLYNYTFIQYALVHRQINGTGYTYESNDDIILIIVYFTIIRHIPIIIFHVYIFVSPMLYKHELYNVMRNRILFIFIIIILNKVCFSRLLPILIVIVTDIQYNIGQDVILDISMYIFIVKWIILILVLYIVSMYILYTNKSNIASSISMYRRMYIFVICILFVISDDVSMDGVYILALLITIFTELLVLLYAMYVNIVRLI